MNDNRRLDDPIERIVSDIWSDLAHDVAEIVRERRRRGAVEAYRQPTSTTLGQQALVAPDRHSFARARLDGRSAGRSAGR